MIKNTMPGAVQHPQSGAKFDSMLAEVSNSSPCDIIILGPCGVNDATQCDEPESCRGSIRSLLSAAKDKAHHVVVLPPPPINTNPQLLGNILATTGIIQQEAEKMEVQVVSLNKLPSGDNKPRLYKSDNLHLTRAGSGYYGLALIQHMRENFPDLLKNTPVCTGCQRTGHIGPRCPSNPYATRRHQTSPWKPSQSPKRPPPRYHGKTALQLIAMEI